MGTSRFDTVLANAFIGPGMVGNPFGVNFYVSNTTNPSENQGAAGTTQQGRTPKNPFATIQAAIDEAVGGRGDIVWIQRGPYTETLAVNKAGLTLIGAVPYGYPDHVIVTGITSITASNCSFYNMEFFSNSADAASVIVGAFTAGVNSTWFENCSFASDGTTEPEAGAIVWGGNNNSFRNCRFIDNTFALALRSNTDSMLTHLSIVGCEFMGNTTADLSTQPMATASATVANSGAATVTNGVSAGVISAHFEGNFFGAGDVVPTDFINIVGTSSGTMADNRFGSATHDTATITVPAGLLVVSSKTEAGESTARPA